LYGAVGSNGTAAEDSSDSEGGDIEAEIKKELADIRKPTTKPLFTSLKLDTQCCEDSQSCFRRLGLTHPSDVF
jgi:tRNA acetyltransferase TAN1